MIDDLYEILQVHQRADSAAIEAAYTRLRALYDPARLDGVADELAALAREKRDAIERAYIVLGDPARRAAYDAERAGQQKMVERKPADDQPSARQDRAPKNEQQEPAALPDYRPLPPARRQERPRGFNAQPTTSIRTRSGLSAQGKARRWTAPAIITGLLAVVVTISMTLTSGGGPPPAPPAPTPSPLDQFEAIIPQARQAAEQNPTDPQAWIDYGNILYDSAQIVREQASDTPLYQQRLGRWLDATVAYSRALTLEPSNAAVRADLGASACFYGAGTGDDNFIRNGIVETRRAAQATPNDPRVLLSLGYCLVSSRPPATQEAITVWQRVVQIAPADSPLVSQARLLIQQYSR